MEKSINYNKITFSIIKPDAVVQGFANKINAMLEENGFKIILQRKTQITLEEAEFFYAEHKERPFFKDLTNFLASGPAVIQVLYHPEEAVIKYRTIMGATNPKEAADNTIRKLYGHSINYNAVHGSDSSISSQRETC